jgi:hypothetical protein
MKPKKLLSGYSELLLHCKAAGQEILAWDKDARGWGWIVLDGEKIGTKIEGWIRISEGESVNFITVS